MRCVKLTLPPRPRARWLLITIRLSASSLAGTARTLVAVGTVSDSSMLATTRAATPRRMLVAAPAGTARAGAGFAAAGRPSPDAAAGAGLAAGAATGGAAEADGAEGADGALGAVGALGAFGLFGAACGGVSRA